MSNDQMDTQQQFPDKTESYKKKSIESFCLFPIKDWEVYKIYKEHERIHWTADELDFVKDLEDYKRVSPEVRHSLETILKFFLPADGAVSENLIYRFIAETKEYEQMSMFISQLHRELIHAETYGLAFVTFMGDAVPMEEQLKSIGDSKCTKLKMDFMEKWTNADEPKYKRLLAFACAEGIFFCTLFAVIYWYGNENIFQNFFKANEFIAKDESMHKDFLCLLFNREVSKMPKGMSDSLVSEAQQIVRESIEIEDAFIEEMIKGDMGSMSVESLKTYARMIADNLLSQINVPIIYHAENPFTWIDKISFQRKSNFYETVVATYSRRSIEEIIDWDTRTGKKQAVAKEIDEIDF